MAGKKESGFTTYQEAIRFLQNGKVTSLYLLSGEERYLQDHFIRKLHALCLDPATRDMDLQIYSGTGKQKPPSFAALTLQSQTPAFCSPRRVFQFENTGWFGTGGSKNTELLEWLLSLKEREDICVLFREDQVDRKQKKLLDCVRSVGLWVQMDRQKPQALEAWVRQFANHLGFSLDPDAQTSLLLRTDGEMLLLSQELQKLALFAKGAGRTQLHLQDVDTLCLPDLSGNIFQLAEWLIQGKREEAWVLQAHLLEQQQSVLLLLTLLARQCRQLVQAQLCRSASDFAQIFNLHPFVGQKLFEQARKIPQKQLYDWYEFCYQTDWSIKTGKMEERLAWELLMSRFASPLATPFG